ncbi:MAG: hypothetical protein IKU45_02470 [Clostridia bacterium]|nr:hypothetical protein [Clostridia bacterium]
MKAMYRPPKPTSKYQRDLRAHVQADVDRYLDTKQETIIDRTCAFVCLTLAKEFGFGPKRLARFLHAFSKECDCQEQDKIDTGDDLLFLHLRQIGLDALCDKIAEDYEQERQAIQDTLFDLNSE